MTNDHRIFLQPLELTPETPDHVALSCLVRMMGDTLGVVNIIEAGGFDVWRNGSCLGVVNSIKEVYDLLDRAEDDDLAVA